MPRHICSFQLHRPWFRQLRRILMLAIACYSASSFDQAAVITWTGQAGDNSWSAAANWDSGTVPTTGDTAVIPALRSPTVHFDTGTTTINALQCEANFT